MRASLFAATNFLATFVGVGLIVGLFEFRQLVALFLDPLIAEMTTDERRIAAQFVDLLFEPLVLLRLSLFEHRGFDGIKQRLKIVGFRLPFEFRQRFFESIPVTRLRGPFSRERSATLAEPPSRSTRPAAIPVGFRFAAVVHHPAAPQLSPERRQG